MIVPTKSNRRIVAVILGIVTLLVAAAAVVIKWFLLKSVHDEIVGKRDRYEPLFFQRGSFCRFVEIPQDFNIVTFSTACLLILILSVTSKRVSFQRGKRCKGYVGLPIPMDFFSHVKRTFAAVIFAICANELLQIVNVILKGNPGSSNRGTPNECRVRLAIVLS